MVHGNRPMKRILAFCLVFVMLVVPFANHISGKDDAKAEGTTGGGIVVTENKTNVEVEKLSLTLEQVNGNLVSHVGADYEKTYTLLKDGEQITKIACPEFSNLGENSQAFYYMIVEAGSEAAALELKDSMIKFDSDADLSSNPISTKKDILIYAMLNPGVSGKADKMCNLQYVIHLNFIDTMFQETDGIYNQDVKVADGTILSSATLKAGVDAADGKIRYFVADAPQEAADLTSAANYTTNSSIEATETLTTKYAYAAYIENDTVLEYKSLGNVQMIKDTTAPTITEVGLAEQTSDTEAYQSVSDTYKKENVYYGLDGYSYQYTVKVEDIAGTDEGASGLKTVTANITGTTDALTVTQDTSNISNYIIAIPKDKISTTQPIQVEVTATDAVGVSTTQVLSLSIQNVEKKDLEFVTAAFTESDTTSPIRTQKSIKAEFSTTVYSTVTTSQLVDLNSNAYSVTSTDVVPNATNPREKTVYVTFTVPSNALLTTSNKIKEFTYFYKGNNGNPSTGGFELSNEILYDPVAPTITNPVIEASTDGITWTGVADAATTDIYVTEIDKPYYRYAVTVTDDTNGSGVGNVYYKMGETEVSFTQDTAVLNKYVYDCTNSSSSGIPYSVTVQAVDKAGNNSAGYNLRPIQKIDADLKVDYVIQDANGTALTVDEVNALLTKKYTNKKHTIKVTASSAYKISAINMQTQSEVQTGTVSGNDENEKKANGNRYTASATFELPKEDINKFFDGIYFVVTDEGNASVNYPDNQGFGSILYDHSTPYVTNANALEDKWYKEYNVAYTIASGNQSVESPLTTASYVVTNGKTGDSKELADNVAASVNGTISIPESLSVQGTLVTFRAKDAALNEMAPQTYTIKVDKTKPTIDFKVNGKNILSKPIEGDVTIKADVSDNLTVQMATIHVQGPGVDMTRSICDGGNAQKNTFKLNDLLGEKAQDGAYTVTVNVSDKAGNSASKKISFTVDNTIPVVTAKIQGGTMGEKQPGQNFDGTLCDYFYRSNVSVLLTYEDSNLSASNVAVTDNGTPVTVKWTRVGQTNKYQAVYTAVSDGVHTIRIGATDDAGNEAIAKQIVFVKDTVAPTITAVVNGGQIYEDRMGEVDLLGNAAITFSVNDANEDKADFNYQLVKTLPDQIPVTADVIQTENRIFGYEDEADYVVKAYSVDRAGNRSADKTVRFRIDKTAPDIQISGSASGSNLSSGTTLTFSMTEAFWWDASGTVTITRKAGDSAAEENYKTLDFKPTARTTTMTETLSQTGEYKISFTAKDRAGHTAETSNYTVRIDTGKPVITLNGVANNDKTTSSVEFMAQIEEDFYLTKSVNITASRTYLDKTSYQEKTEELQITGYNPTAATTVIRNTFTEDGIYKLQIHCKDAAGNEDTQEVSFTIDKTNPVIDSKVLAAYEGTLTSFAWDYDLNDIIYDLTVCDVHMYLNGSEYDGTSEIEDGAYEMKLVAEDELGNKTEETVSFNLDTKAPTFIVTGVEDGEIKNEPYNIQVSLQLEEDVLDSVSLNGETIEVKENQASLTVEEKGDYTLTMKAHDAAGNEAEKTIQFTYGDKKQTVLIIIISVASLAVIGGAGAGIVIARKKK